MSVLYSAVLRQIQDTISELDELRSEVSTLAIALEEVTEGLEGCLGLLEEDSSGDWKSESDAFVEGMSKLKELNR